MVYSRSLGWVLLFTLLVMGLGSTSPAATITIKADGTGDFPTIQAAIDAAAAGDEVVLQPGTYTGDGNRDIEFRGKTLTVQSTDPDDPDVVDATIVDCQGSATQWHNGFNFVHSEGPETLLAGVTIRNSYTEYGEPGAIDGLYASPVIRNCHLTNNYPLGVTTLEGDPVIIGCRVIGNDSGMLLWLGQPEVRGCQVSYNLEHGIVCVPVKIADCVITDNGESGIWIWSFSDDDCISNCLILRNGIGRYYNSAGIIVSAGMPLVSHCTIAANGGVAGIACEFVIPLLDHCIIWGNTGLPLSNTFGDPVDFENNPPPYCSVLDMQVPGKGNLCIDPKLTWNGHLLPDSPCINAGDPAFAAAPGQTDIDGQLRALGGCVDIGADEFATPGDANADGVVNVADLQVLVAAWAAVWGDPGYRTCADLDGDGHVNVGDLQLLVSNWDSH